MLDASRLAPVLKWDIFCQVIDNFGDLGVCWRLACNLAPRGQQVRLWVDDPSALRWMAPNGGSGIEVRAWVQPLPLAGISPGEVLVEAFGCAVDSDFLALYAASQPSRKQPGIWLNFEYLSAEPYVERNHALNSPVSSGPGVGLQKYFYYPGFTARTGGLLREADLLERQSQFDRAAWLAQHVPQWQADEQLISLFCYEPVALQSLLLQLAQQSTATRLLVTPGRASDAVRACMLELTQSQPQWNAHKHLRLTYLAPLSQIDFDHLLWACDFNAVRGEDSLVRALWAGKPLVWHMYPQADGAHAGKLEAFLDWLQAPPEMRQFHTTWNALGAAPLAPIDFAAWGQTVRQARQRLLEHADLADQMLEFVRSRLG